ISASYPAGRARRPRITPDESARCVVSAGGRAERPTTGSVVAGFGGASGPRSAVGGAAGRAGGGGCVAGRGRLSTGGAAPGRGGDGVPVRGPGWSGAGRGARSTGDEGVRGAPPNSDWPGPAGRAGTLVDGPSPPRLGGGDGGACWPGRLIWGGGCGCPLVGDPGSPGGRPSTGAPPAPERSTPGTPLPLALPRRPEVPGAAG